MSASPPPPPRVSRCWTLLTPAQVVDVEVTARDGDLLGVVLQELTDVVGVSEPTAWYGPTRLSPALPLSAPELAHGAILGLGGPGPRAMAQRVGNALELHVTSGPDAGRTVPLEQGRHVLGRGDDAEIALRDPDVSRRHVAVEVGSGELSVADLGSTNGTLLDGMPLDTRPRRWPPGSALRLGSTTARVTGPGSGAAAVGPAAGGRAVVRSPHRLTAPPPQVDVAFPRPPEPPAPRRLPWAAAALPAVGGAVMAVVLHTPTFLFFAVLSPLVAIGSWVSDRWSARRTSRRDAAAHAAATQVARERLEAAVRADLTAMEAAHPDLATVVAGARRRSSPLWSRRRDDDDALVLRLGSGRTASRVMRVDGDGSRTPEEHLHAPVTIDLRMSGGLGVVGPRSCVTAVVAGVVAQLAGLHAPGEVELLLLTDAGRLPDWQWARWLPHLWTPGTVALDERGPALERALAGRGPGTVGTHGWLVVVVDRPLDGRTAARLRSARGAGVLLVTGAPTQEGLPVPVGAVLTTTGEVGETAVLAREGAPASMPFVVDRLPPDTAAGFARDLAPLQPAATGTRLPRLVQLRDVPGPGLRANGPDDVTGRWIRDRTALHATIGRTEQGPVGIDLCRHGPHALVAGTTGSGKSELLQTLITSLALNHPPDHCSFLLVDYKGGAAFAEAAALPHTVGVLTDLDGQTTARALRSLTAELTRRESLLAGHRVADVGDLPDGVDLARLVIVVDEFATLAEELPGFVPGLVGIAQRGRSLGVHLVLATQRPAGVVSPEIRANCTLRICLRTTDEADSRDLLGVPDAAHLPIDLPGRGFVRTGSGAAVPVQVARVATRTVDRSGPTARRWLWPPVPDPAPAQEERPGRTELARLVAAVQRHAERSGLRGPHRPWLAPLPDVVAAGDLPAQGGRRVPLGLVDRPELQSQDVLALDLDVGGGWLAVGGPRSGRTTLLRTVLAGAVAACSADELHVHVLDHGGGALATEARTVPHAGTCVGAEDSLRTVRLLDRLAEEITVRRSGAAAEARPRLLLLVDGVEFLMAQLDECDPTRGSAALLRLVRDGAAVGLTCVLTADRAVPGSRLAAVAAERLVLPLSDRADYAVAGVAPAAVPSHRPPGRALVGDAAFECQLARFTGALPVDRWNTGRAGAEGPLHIAELTPDPVLPADDGRRGPAAGALEVILGPGGDDGRPLRWDLDRQGGLLVVGPPGSGRTATLDALVEELTARGTAVLRVDARGPVRDDPADRCATWIDPRDTHGLSAWLTGLSDTGGVIVADDLGAAVDWPVVAQFSGSDRSHRQPVLIAAGSAAELTAHYQGPIAALRRARTGLLLCPGPAEADVLGVRLPRTPLPVRPGSGWLAAGGRLTRVQVARRRLGNPAAVVG